MKQPLEQSSYDFQGKPRALFKDSSSTLLDSFCVLIIGSHNAQLGSLYALIWIYLVPLTILRFTLSLLRIHLVPYWIRFVPFTMVHITPNQVHFMPLFGFTWFP